MQEQNFEEEVRRKMTELSFPPSDPVWEKVEKEIKNKKDRRKIFLWLLPLLLVPGLTYYFMSDAGEHNTVNSSVINGTSNEQKVTGSKGTKLDSKQLSEAPGDNFSAGVVKQSVGTKTEQSSLSNVPADQKANRPSASYTYKKHIKDIKGSDTGEEADAGNTIRKTVEEPAKNESIEQALDNGGVKTRESSKAVPEQTITVVDSAIVHSVSADSTSVPVMDTVATAIEVVQQKKNAKKRWSISVNSSIGVTGVSTSALAIFNGAKSAVYQSNAFDNMLTTSASSPAAPRSNLRSVVLEDDPSKARRNIGFSAGIGLNRKVNTRVGFSSGLQYTHISTLTSIGRKVQSSTSQVSDFYLNTSLATKDYVTRYHILEMPLSFNWQVAPGVPLKIYAGVTLGYLVSTNALQYDGAMNIYYFDKSLYKRTQISALTGFDYTIMKQGRHSLSLGPKLQFQLSNLLKKKMYGEQHLYFAGLGSSFSF